jgi:hypothetical protein
MDLLLLAAATAFIAQGRRLLLEIAGLKTVLVMVYTANLLRNP